MRKVILIPIDFQVESLNTLKLALKQNPGYEINVVLVFCEHQGDSIRELLFYSPKKRLAELAGADFMEAISILQNRFSKTLRSLRIELFHGFNAAAFLNFTDGNGINEIYIPKTYALKKSGNSFSPLNLIRGSKLQVIEMDWTTDPSLSKQDQLALLFNN